jgi:hypothetical protein
MENLSKFLFVTFLVVGLNACSTNSAVSGVGFMDRDDLSEFAGEEPIDEQRYTGYRTFRTSKTLGAISLNRFNEETSEDEKTLMKIKRHRSFFYAEANLFESDNKDKSFFDESVFNFGVDRKTKGLNFEVSLKF